MRPNIPQYTRPADQEQWVFSRGFNHGYIAMDAELRPYTSDALNIAYQAGFAKGINQRIEDKKAV